MINKDEVRNVLRRHEAFWQCSDADKPIIGTVRTPRDPLRDFDWGLPEGEGALQPEMVVVGHFLPQVEAYFQTRGLLDGELFWPVVPTRSIPWLEAIMGGAIHFSNDSGIVNIFAEPIIKDWNQSLILPSLDGNPWFRKLIEFIEGLVMMSAGRFPLAGSHTRGPWDIVSALRGLSNTFIDLHSNPVQLTKLADQCAHLWIQVTQILAEIIPAWEGGYVGVFGVWAPGFTPMPQNDTSVSVSPRMYRELLYPCDLRTIQAWRYPMFHTHSAGVHLLEGMLELLSNRGALNVVIDENGPSLEKLIPVLRKVQEGKVPLHLVSGLWQQVEELILALSPKGLAISYVPPL
jgi:hypothetical protein